MVALWRIEELRASLGGEVSVYELKQKIHSWLLHTWVGNLTPELTEVINM